VKIVISGGAGFLGSLLARRLLQRGRIASRNGRTETIDAITLLDGSHPQQAPLDDGLVERVTGDIRDIGVVRAVVDRDDIAIVHLAAIVSAAAEKDLDLAYQVNVEGTRNLLDACRERAGAPRFVFASSIAAFGGSDARNGASDTTRVSPETTYGCTKAIGELLVNEYSRRNRVDGRIARLPTVIIRSGTPNAAASSFASSIFREPLRGERYVVPVPADTPIVVLGYRAAVECLVRLLEVDLDALPRGDRAVNVPGLSVVVSEMIESLARVAGPGVLSRISVRPDPATAEIVGSWPVTWEAERAVQLGLAGSESLDGIVREYIDDFHKAAPPGTA
jgi:nucleoside-diphosphate-sugar epimerase